ncbi:MAG TPA: TIGR03085 family metal-binding protein [Streptosporangiaceae bacterium]
MTYARDERLAVAVLLSEVGPGAPTLCAGWQAKDLAAHLVLRERRPDAGLGVLGGPLAGHTRRVQDRLAMRTPFPQLIEMIRTGPPRLSVFALPGADAQANSVEYFVHHEDIRRAQPGWEPRELDPGMSELLWKRLRMARLILRRAPVGVELARDDDPGRDGRGTDGPLRITAKARAPMVTVSGTPAELTMWAFGRDGTARVRMEGSAPDIAALSSAGWRSH